MMQYRTITNAVSLSRRIHINVTKCPFAQKVVVKKNLLIKNKKTTLKNTTFAYNHPIGAVPSPQAHDHRRNTNP